jgi:ribonuclease-3
MRTGWLQQALGYRCRDPALIEAALTHRSAHGREARGQEKGDDNERLEFLGDGVLNFIVAHLLYRERPQANEGELSRLRATLVRGETLAELAVQLGLGEQLNLGTGERRSGGFRRESILADALEAVFGAIYLDGGFEAAREVIERLMLPRLAALPTVAELKDPKTRLQEWLQGKGLALPLYRVEKVEGEAHLQVFTVTCEVRALKVRAAGSGQSRRRAEQAAAQAVLSVLESLGINEEKTGQESEQGR